MKLKMNQIIEIQMFYNNIKNTKLPLKTAYKLNKLFIQINEELSFYQQKFTEIINEFGKRDENGELMYSSDKTSIEIMDGRRLECQQKIEERPCKYRSNTRPYARFRKRNAFFTVFLYDFRFPPALQTVFSFKQTGSTYRQGL